MSETEKLQARLSGGMKFMLDFGPLLLFFIAVSQWGVVPATGVLMAAMALSVAIHWLVERHVPKMHLFGLAVVLVMGGLTLFFNNDTFVKMKMTVIQVVIALVLLGGMQRGKLFFQMLLGEAIKMEEKGWRIFTRNYALFCLVIAAANEVVWRTQSDEIWAGFKTFGILPLTALFAFLQIWALMKYIDMKSLEEADPSDSKEK